MEVLTVCVDDLKCLNSGRPSSREYRDCGCEPCRLYRRSVTAAATAITLFVADLIREQGRVPAGVVFAALQTKGMTADQFRGLVDLLCSTGTVREQGDELVWTGPK